MFEGSPLHALGLYWSACTNFINIRSIDVHFFELVAVNSRFVLTHVDYFVDSSKSFEVKSVPGEENTALY